LTAPLQRTYNAQLVLGPCPVEYGTKGDGVGQLDVVHAFYLISAHESTSHPTGLDIGRCDLHTARSGGGGGFSGGGRILVLVLVLRAIGFGSESRRQPQGQPMELSCSLRALHDEGQDASLFRDRCGR